MNKINESDYSVVVKGADPSLTFRLQLAMREALNAEIRRRNEEKRQILEAFIESSTYDNYHERFLREVYQRGQDVSYFDQYYTEKEALMFRAFRDTLLVAAYQYDGEEKADRVDSAMERIFQVWLTGTLDENRFMKEDLLNSFQYEFNWLKSGEDDSNN